MTVSLFVALFEKKKKTWEGILGWLVSQGVRQRNASNNTKNSQSKGKIMNRLNLLKKVVCGMLVAGAIGFVGTSTASATHYPPSCYYKTVIVWEHQTQPVVDWVTKYDHCGKPYEVKVVRYVTVKVPVKKLVKVCY